MSSTTALPLYAAVRSALSDCKYSSDPCDKFLIDLHARGFEIVPRNAETPKGPAPDIDAISDEPIAMVA